MNNMLPAEMEMAILPDYSGPPLADNNLLAQLIPLTEEELGIKFDELAEMAINQPDDELALNGLRQVVLEAHARGKIDMAMQMAMTLGAMACLHPHMEELANDTGASLGLEDSGSRKNSDKESKHNRAKCENCRTGKACSRN